MGLIGDDNQKIFSSKLYSQIGVGVIISNDYFIDKLVEFKEIEKPRKKWSIHLYLFYMILIKFLPYHLSKAISVYLILYDFIAIFSVIV